MRSIPIEIDAGRRGPLGMPPARFLRDYWQKRPLLIRGAFAGFESPIDPDELAGLACEPLASSRIVVHDARRDRYTLESGPFDEARLSRFPNRRASLLVQDCDKLLAEVDAILEHFRFVPSWRIDDVMISYATDGGSVGAHVDQYDVFLLQATGVRRWAIDARREAPRAFRADSELKLLERFEPDHEWRCAPGDVLYLPPGVPHHGVAEGACTTWSIGMRAPSAAEMLVDYADHLASRLDEAVRYADPDLAPAGDPAAVDDDAVARVIGALERAFTLDREAVAAWLVPYLTRYRAAHDAAPAARAPRAEMLERRLARGAALHRSPWSRIATRRARRGAVVALGGDEYVTSRALAALLGRAKRYDRRDLGELAAPDWAALAAMVAAGHLVIAP